jgi:hypothetical protein
VPPTPWAPPNLLEYVDGQARHGDLGLRKTDLDLDSRTILVARSYDRETTKGGHED